MTYEVTATRKRPQVFDELVGQEFIITTLKNSIEQKRIAHAYLFSGPRGVGKLLQPEYLPNRLTVKKARLPIPAASATHAEKLQPEILWTL